MSRYLLGNVDVVAPGLLLFEVDAQMVEDHLGGFVAFAVEQPDEFQVLLCDLTVEQP